LSCKAQDCGYNKTTTKLDSLLKFKIRQILMRFLANPQPYIWHKLPQHVAIFLWRIWIIVVFKKNVVWFEFHLQNKIPCIRKN
jgi:hypothetical protein